MFKKYWAMSKKIEHCQNIFELANGIGINGFWRNFSFSALSTLWAGFEIRLLMFHTSTGPKLFWACPSIFVLDQNVKFSSEKSILVGSKIIFILLTYCAWHCFDRHLNCYSLTIRDSSGIVFDGALRLQMNLLCNKNAGAWVSMVSYLKN